MFPYSCMHYAKPWLHSDISSCCCQSFHMHSGMILLYLATPFFTSKVFLYEDIITFCKVYVCMYVCIFGYCHPSEPLLCRHHSASAADENSLLPLELALIFTLYNFVTYVQLCCFLQFCMYTLHAFLYVVLLLATRVASYCQLHNIKIIL